MNVTGSSLGRMNPLMLWPLSIHVNSLELCKCLSAVVLSLDVEMQLLHWTHTGRLLWGPHISLSCRTLTHPLAGVGSTLLAALVFTMIRICCYFLFFSNCSLHFSLCAILLSHIKFFWPSWPACLLSLAIVHAIYQVSCLCLQILYTAGCIIGNSLPLSCAD